MIHVSFFLVVTPSIHPEDGGSIVLRMLVSYRITTRCH